MHKALTIAGSDSGGGAGIQTDLKTFAALGVYGTSVITALTAQNTQGVHGIHAVPADFITCQLEAVLSDIPVQAAKTGMLGEVDAILAVTGALTQYRIINLVVDPVMVAESGHRLLKADAVDALRTKLLPLALVVTPNLPEAEVLLGRTIETVDDMIIAARDIRKMGPRHVLVKGGHLQGTEMVDVFYDGKAVFQFSEKKLDTVHTHGTGCTYAAAITAYLAKGYTPLDAVSRAKRFITDAISHGVCVGSGYGPTNPMGVLYHELAQKRATDDLQTALGILQKSTFAVNLLAAGKSNIFTCRENARLSSDIASFPAPLLRCGDGLEPVGEPRFDSAMVPGEALLQAHGTNPAISGMINLRSTPDIITALQTQGITVSEHTGELRGLQLTTDALIFREQPNTEPQLLLFGQSATDAAEKTASLARAFSRC